ncbi:brassinosteroid-responsive RING protein [Trifolium repens]|nr:brassinosteroid-responsive RING protein [Trifolium repens]
MGFPTEIVLPKVFVQLLSVLSFIRKIIAILFFYIGLNSEFPFSETIPEFSPVNPLILIREILPVVKFSELAVVEYLPESCTVCLSEFKAEDEIQRLINCRHIFHRNCIDRWMGYDHITCPLCRTMILPYHHMQDA